MYNGRKDGKPQRWNADCWRGGEISLPAILGVAIHRKVIYNVIYIEKLNIR